MISYSFCTFRVKGQILRKVHFIFQDNITHVFDKNGSGQHVPDNSCLTGYAWEPELSGGLTVSALLYYMFTNLTWNWNMLASVIKFREMPNVFSRNYIQSYKVCFHWNLLFWFYID